jgi:hypothetical protein
MQLTYRGIAYSLTSTSIHPSIVNPLDTSAKAVVAKYRGAAYLIQQGSTSVMPKCPFNLKYRGAHYYPESFYPVDPGLASI